MKTLMDLMKTTELQIKEGQNLVISDPCYELKGVIKNSQDGYLFVREAKSGTWTYDFNEDTKTLNVYELSSEFCIKDDGIDNYIFDEVVYIGVDSGQFGVFLEDSFNKNELINGIDLENSFTDLSPWYRSCCIVTTTGDRVGFIPNGFVSGTMHGDGCYPVGIKYEKGTRKAKYIRVITDYMCEHCNKEESLCDCSECEHCRRKEDDCDCKYCHHCGRKEGDCYCEFCDNCGEPIDECSCYDEEDID